MPTPSEAYVNSVERRGGSGARLRPADFGAAGETLGRAAQGFGQGIKQVGEAIETIQDERSKVRLQDGMNRFQAAVMKHGYEGPDAYFNKQNVSAIEGFTPYMDALRKERESISEQFKNDPKAQRLFGEAADRYEIDMRKQALMHQSKEEATYASATYKGGIDLHVQQAAVSPDMAVKEQHIASAGNLAEARARKLGITDPNVIAAERRIATGEAILAVVDDFENTDPLKGMAFLDSNRNRVPPDKYDATRDALAPRVLVQETDAGIDAFINGTNTVTEEGGAPPADGTTPSATTEYGYGNYGGRAANAPVASPTPAAAAVPKGRIKATGVAGRLAQGLSAEGFNPIVVAGFLGNIQQESSFNNKGSGDSHSAHGYVQWRFDRVDNFQRIVGVHPRNASEAQTAKFIKWEMDNPLSAGMGKTQASAIANRNKILNAKSPEEAARLIDQFYERSDGKHRSVRANNARKFYEGGDAPDQGGGSSGATEETEGVQRIDRAVVVARIKAAGMDYVKEQAYIGALDRRIDAQNREEAIADDQLTERVASWMTTLGDPDTFTSVDQMPATLLADVKKSSKQLLFYQKQASANFQTAEIRQRTKDKEAKGELAEQADFDMGMMALHNSRGFMEMDFTKAVPGLSGADRVRYESMRLQMIDSVNKPGALVPDFAAIRTLVNTYGVGAGKPISAADAKKDPQRAENINLKAAAWEQAFIAKEKRRPNPGERQAQIQLLATPATLSSGKVVPVAELTGGQVGRADIRAVTRARYMRDNGGRVPSERLIDALIEEARQVGALGGGPASEPVSRAPRSRETMRGFGG